MLAVSMISTTVSYFTPTNGFMYSLVVTFAFNIWAGMRADGITITSCKRFSFKKFKNALAELLLYLIIIWLMYFIMNSCGDPNTALIIVKAITYVIMYVYIQNAFRNLVLAYPNRPAIRVIYHIIRFEFNKVISQYVDGVLSKIDELDKEIKDKEN